MSSDRVDPRIVDALLGVAIALGIALVVAAQAAQSGDARPGAYVFALGFGILMGRRRAFPRVVLVLTVLGIFTYYALEFPPIGIALPAVAALYSAAEQNRTRSAVVAAFALIGVAAFFQIAEGREPTAYLVSYDILTNAALAAASIALGLSVHARREGRRQQARIAELVAADQARAAEQRLQAERVEVARDVHDVVGHTLSVVAVHAHVADEAIGHDDDAARRAVAQIRETTAQTMGELRATVRMLRTPSEHTDTAMLGVTGLNRLADTARDAGLAVELEVDVPGGALSGPIDTAAYRIVQEALTNVIRHAGATRATVRAAFHDGWLELDVADDGVGDTARPTTHDGAGDRAGRGAPSAGILGMTERARLLGGDLTAGPAPSGGFAVHARLPARLDR